MSGFKSDWVDPREHVFVKTGVRTLLVLALGYGLTADVQLWQNNRMDDAGRADPDFAR